MNLTYFGHSAFQVSVDQKTVLVDPFISGNPFATGVVEIESLVPDVILLTHAHGDHFGDTPAIAAQSGAVVVANYEITQYLSLQHGHENVRPMNTGGATEFEWGRVTQTYARHSSSFPDGSYGGNPNGYIIEAGDVTVYALGDTSPFAEMEWIGKDYDIDLALVPIGDCFTMGPRASLRAVQMLHPSITVPTHYNTFPQIEIDLGEWELLMREAGHVSRILAPGESLEL